MRPILNLVWFVAVLPVCNSQTLPARLSALPAAAHRSILQSLSQDMPWSQLAELTASDGGPDDELGWSVAVSGNTVVVGAPFANVGSNQSQGAAYVFVKPKSGWENMTQVAKLTASDGQPDDRFGWSVAVSGDTVTVGNFNLGDEVGDYVFVKPPDGWKNNTETAKLACGPYVAISGDTAVCASFRSQAYVYVKPKNGWKSTFDYDALLVTTDGDKNFFSSISIDGDVLVIGAADSNNESDVAYLYVKPKGGWTITSNPTHLAAQTAKLTASDSNSGDYFGLSVSVSGDSVAVGAPDAIVNPPNKGGAAYVFVKPASGWVNMNETAKLTAAATDDNSSLGTSVAIRGGTLVAGNPTGSIANNLEGQAYVFVEPAGGWATTSTFNAVLTPSDDQRFDQFGGAVAINSRAIVVGDTHFELLHPGAAFVFGH
jgi:hypothetical protein